MRWYAIKAELESRGFRYYQSSYGPISLDTWTGPDNMNGQFHFVGNSSISDGSSTYNFS